MAGGLLGLGGGLAYQNRDAIAKMFQGGGTEAVPAREQLLEQARNSGVFGGATPAEQLDAQNKLLQMGPQQAIEARNSGALTPEQYEVWAKSQLVPEGGGGGPSWWDKMTGVAEKPDFEVPSWAENPATRNLSDLALQGEQKRIIEDGLVTLSLRGILGSPLSTQHLSVSLLLSQDLSNLGSRTSFQLCRSLP